MKKYFFITILLLFVGDNGFAAEEGIKQDSLQNLLQNASQKDSIKYLMAIGQDYFISEDYAKSLDYFFLSIKLSEAQSEPAGTADASNSIGRVYYEMGNFKQGLVYFNNSLNLYELLNDNERMGGVLNNLALIYYEIDSIDQAIEYYNKALELKKVNGNKLDIAAIYHNLGLVFIQQNKFDQAIENLISSRKIFIELNKKKHAVNALNNIGRAYYKSGRYKEALKYFKQGYRDAKQINSTFFIMDNYKYQADCYAKLGIYNKAYRYSNRYYNLKDSLLNIEKKKELATIQAKYENEIEKQEIGLLKKENDANEATIKMQKMVGVGILVIMILIGVMALFYYRGNLAIKKANQSLKTQQNEIQKKNNSLTQLNNEIIIQNDAIIGQKKELEELNNIKDKLFSIISHEFRSPLNSLKGTLTLLKVGALSNDELNLISKELNDKINNTSIFLDNLLNWAKSQMHGINSKPVQIKMRELAENNIQLLKSLATKKKILLKNNIPEDCTAFVDPNMMNLIFRNLISNAIKFSLQGSIIEISSESKNNINTISVNDSGIGMSAENIKMLFQVQSITTRGTANERGTGLGLFITKNFVESNGGKIWVESGEGSGSTFKFTMPIAQI